MGIIGRRLVSVLSLVVTIVTFWAALSRHQMRGTKLAIAGQQQSSGFQKIDLGANLPD
jgi:hypothetical protein